MNILYIGRFQPFHLGHADAIAQIFEQNKNVKKLYIGIGSAENNFTQDNPLTAGERFEIIEKVMQELHISSDKYTIVPIRNIDHYALWPYHVQQYLPLIQHFYSVSPLVLQLWKNAFPNTTITQIIKRKDISGTQVRNMITGNISLKKYCLQSTIDILQEKKIKERLKNMKTV